MNWPGSSTRAERDAGGEDIGGSGGGQFEKTEEVFYLASANNTASFCWHVLASSVACDPFLNAIAYEQTRTTGSTSMNGWRTKRCSPRPMPAAMASLDVTGSGKNVRIDCPFNCEGDHASKREIAVDTESPGKLWKCHAYGCECRGNLLNLMYGWINGRSGPATSFAVPNSTTCEQVIAGEKPAGTPPLRPAAKTTETVAEAKKNLPLTADERTQALMDPPLWEKLVTDVAAMSPEASAYVRRHPCLSSEAMNKWQVWGTCRKTAAATSVAGRSATTSSIRFVTKTAR